MKPWRILYLVVMMISLGLAAIFYWQYQSVDRELLEYQQLSHFSHEAFTKVSAELVRTKQKLQEAFKKEKESLQELERLARAIKTLERDNLAFKDELQALKEERKQLQARVGKLSEEKAALENKVFSLKELRKLIRIAKIQMKIERIQRRLAKIEALRKLDEIGLQRGNRGYLVKQSTSTFQSGTRVRVELEPLRKQ